VRDGIPTLAIGGRVVARLAGPDRSVVGLYKLYRDNRNEPIVLHALASAGAPLVARFQGGGFGVSDDIVRLGPRLFRVVRTWRNTSGKEQDVVLSFELARATEVSFYMIPGVSYDGNRRWPRAAFQGLAAPMAPADAAESMAGAQWVVAGDRPSLPAGTITEGDGYAVGVYADPADASESACSIAKSPHGLVQRLWWPHEEQPHAIVGAGRYVEAPWETVNLIPDQQISRTFYLAVAPAAEPRLGYGAILDEAWRQFAHDVPRRRTPREVWDLGIRYAKTSLWVDRPEYVGFAFSLEPKGEGFVQATWPWRYEIGFVGQAAALGAFMVQDFLSTGNEDSWRRGAAALDFWAKSGRYSNGLFVNRYDDRIALVDDPILTTRNLGDGAYFFLLASELAEKAGRAQPLWRETGLGPCNFFVGHALPGGTFGKKWRASGTLVDADGTIGAFMIPPLIKAYRLTGRDEYLQTAVRAFRAYADDDLDAVCLTAGAIDQDTIDKETGYPLLSGGLDLYEITHDRYYLGAARRAAYYLASWQYHYSVRFPAGSPAAEMGCDSFGGTSVSVGGGGADQGGAVLALGWLRLAAATSEPIWRERALAAWGYSTIGISDGTLRLNGKVLPAGAQYEGLSFARGQSSYTSRQGWSNEWLCAWMGAFRLWTLQHWPTWQDLE
jgi:hypothetical protein